MHLSGNRNFSGLEIFPERYLQTKRSNIYSLFTSAFTCQKGFPENYVEGGNYGIRSYDEDVVAASYAYMYVFTVLICALGLCADMLPIQPSHHAPLYTMISREEEIRATFGQSTSLLYLHLPSPISPLLHSARRRIGAAVDADL